MEAVTGLDSVIDGIGFATSIPQIAGTDVNAKPMDIFRIHLVTEISSAFSLDRNTVYEAIIPTPDTSLGDLDVVIPRLRLTVDEVIEKIKEHRLSLPLFEYYFIDGVHIRCFISRAKLPRLLLPYISFRDKEYGHVPSLGLKSREAPEQGRNKVVVEFSSPNIPSEFEDTHLRSTIAGSFISNVYEAMGYDVVRLNYLGDWGKQIGLLAAGWGRYGNEEALQADPIRHILDVFTKIKEDFKPEEKARKEAKGAKEDTAAIEGKGIFAERDAFFKRMEDKDPEALALWNRFRDINIKDLDLAYERMGVRFDEYSGESQVKPETMAEVEGLLRDKGVLEESEGSWIIDFTKHDGVKKGLGTVIVRSRTGATTYFSRDLAAVLDRERAYDFDKMIYVATARQDLHFSQVFAALGLMGREDLRNKLQHINFARIHGMSKFLGGAHTLGAILDQSSQLMLDAMAAEAVAAKAAEDAGASASSEASVPMLPTVTADYVATLGDMATVAGIVSQDVAYRRATVSSYDPKNMATLQRNSGLKLLGCRAKLMGAMDKLKEQVAGHEEAEIDYAPLEKTSPADLMCVMIQYPDITATAYHNHEPSTVLSYLCLLCDAANKFLSSSDGDDDEGAYEDVDSGICVDTDADDSAMLKKAAQQDTHKASPSIGELKGKMLLCENALRVLENGMRLIGIPGLA